MKNMKKRERDSERLREISMNQAHKREDKEGIQGVRGNLLMMVSQ